MSEFKIGDRVVVNNDPKHSFHKWKGKVTSVAPDIDVGRDLHRRIYVQFSVIHSDWFAVDELLHEPVVDRLGRLA